MRRRWFLNSVPLLVAGLLPSCGEPSTAGPAPPIEGLPRELTVAETAIVSASNRFAFDLLGEIVHRQPASNVFISPLSASMALGMTMNGAAGNTLNEMRQTLGFGTLPLAEINESYRGLIDVLGNLDPEVEFTIGNSIWVREGFGVEPSFLEVVRTYFDAEVAALDFGDPGAATTINDWVRRSTNGKIDRMVEPPIDPLTMMFLMNAIYFNGSWTVRFDEEATRDDVFHRGDGSTVPIKLMHKDDTLAYSWSPELEVVDVPYGGQAYSMTVLLPGPGEDVTALALALGDAVWEGVMGGLRREKGSLLLPRFQVEWERQLGDVLQAMGMRDAFLPGAADFTPMYALAKEAELHIQRVKQKTYVRVDEEGTEAAAVTSVEVGVTSAGLVVRVDRPFLFAIRERFSGTILFLGLIQDPPMA